MPQDFIFSILMLIVGLVIIGVGIYSAFHQKIYYDAADKSVVTEVDIPLVGKVKTNVPAIALCLIGLAPVFFGYNLMKDRSPNLVKFEGEVELDPTIVNDINAVTVGLTSGSWNGTTTPSADQRMRVELSVPDTWPSYVAYAFVLGASKTRPVIIGTSLENKKFKLRIAP